jgi:DNA-binding MarR family transcriptional regulator
MAGNRPGLMTIDTECSNTYIPGMSKTLSESIQQRRPFGSLEQEAYLNLVRTAADLTDGMEQVLKPAGISSQQYNVLRILRGAGTEGLCRNDVRDRMLTRMPDMTRLLDRMEAAGLVSRTREAADRRLVTTRITEAGRRVLEDLDDAVAAEHRRRLGHMEPAQLRRLIELLALARDGG